MPEPTASTNKLGEFVKQRWLTILIVVLVAIFVVQNTGDSRVHLFWMTLTMPTWLLLAALFLLGVIAGTFRARRRRRPKS